MAIVYGWLMENNGKHPILSIPWEQQQHPISSETLDLSILYNSVLLLAYCSAVVEQRWISWGDDMFHVMFAGGKGTGGTGGFRGQAMTHFHPWNVPS